MPLETRPLWEASVKTISKVLLFPYCCLKGSLPGIMEGSLTRPGTWHPAQARALRYSLSPTCTTVYLSRLG